MANEQTSVPLYAASEVLTAANMNISAGTGVPVFATTVTRDAAFGGAGEKVLAEGQLCYLSASNIVQYYDGAAWATVGPSAAGGLVRVGGGALSSTTTTFSSVFSTTYSNYLIVCDSVTTASSTTIRMTIGGAAANYNWGQNRVSFAGTASALGASAQTDGFVIFDSITTAISSAQIFVYSPFLTTRTSITTQGSNNAATPIIFSGGGILSDNTSYTSFTMASGSTIAGNINIYGLTTS